MMEEDVYDRSRDMEYEMRAYAQEAAEARRRAMPRVFKEYRDARDKLMVLKGTFELMDETEANDAVYDALKALDRLWQIMPGDLMEVVYDEQMREEGTREDHEPYDDDGCDYDREEEEDEEDDDDSEDE